jgi:hypothetical protein
MGSQRNDPHAATPAEQYGLRGAPLAFHHSTNQHPFRLPRTLFSRGKVAQRPPMIM